MTRTASGRILLALCLVGALSIPCRPGDATAQTLVASGSTRITLDARIAGDLGLAVPDAPVVGDGVEFGVAAPSDLELDAVGGDFEGFAAGSLSHASAFTLVARGVEIPLTDFRLAPGSSPLDLDLRDRDGRRWLVLDSIHARLARGLLELRNVDVLLAPELASLLGRPELSWSYLGVVQADWRIVGDVAPSARALAPRGVEECLDVPGLPLDVALVGLGSLTQAAREPGGRVAMAPSARLENVGAGPIPWNFPIAPEIPQGEHPYLVMHFYRLAGGVLEQIGRSDLKHAFFTINTGCPCRPGNVLFPGCRDTYGVFTNLDRFNLAPREELAAHNGAWTALGSHFDGVPRDASRDHFGDLEHDDFEHRLVVREADLQVPGARYFVEGWYVVPGDVDLLNSLGNVEVTPVLADETWAFPVQDAELRQGSILDRLVDPGDAQAQESSVLVDTGEGRVQLAMRVRAEGGVHHYEYALMNFDVDRGLASFSVPRPPGVAITNPSFRDGDADGTNDWSVAIEPRRIVWMAPVGGGLAWGTLVGFAFDADTASEPTTTRAEILPAGAGSHVDLPSRGPRAPARAALAIPSGPVPGEAFAVEVVVDAGETPLGSYAVEFDCHDGVAAIEAVEGGRTAGFDAPPGASFSGCHARFGATLSQEVEAPTGIVSVARVVLRAHPAAPACARSTLRLAVGSLLDADEVPLPAFGVEDVLVLGGCPDDGNACTDDVCDPDTDRCGVPRDGACDDGDPCTIGDACRAGSCQGAAVVCPDDGNPCTVAACDSVAGCAQRPAPNGTPCADGDPCNGSETCRAGQCVAGTPLDCEDGDVCNGGETCAPGLGCQPGQTETIETVMHHLTGAATVPSECRGDVRDRKRGKRVRGDVTRARRLTERAAAATGARRRAKLLQRAARRLERAARGARRVRGEACRAVLGERVGSAVRRLDCL
jgi:hypothetical protein